MTNQLVDLLPTPNLITFEQGSFLLQRLPLAQKPKVPQLLAVCKVEDLYEEEGYMITKLRTKYSNWGIANDLGARVEVKAHPRLMAMLRFCLLCIPAMEIVDDVC